MFNNNVGSCEWDLLRKPLSILIFTEIYIKLGFKLYTPALFLLFFLGGGGEDSTFLFQVLARI